jgi:hypothetical protein
LVFWDESQNLASRDPCRARLLVYYSRINNTFNQVHIIDIYKLFPATTAEYTFLRRSHKTFTKKDYILDTKHTINKLKD